MSFHLFFPLPLCWDGGGRGSKAGWDEEPACPAADATVGPSASWQVPPSALTFESLSISSRESRGVQFTENFRAETQPCGPLSPDSPEAVSALQAWWGEETASTFSSRGPATARPGVWSANRQPWLWAGRWAWRGWGGGRERLQCFLGQDMGMEGRGCVVSRWAGPLGDGEAAVAVPGRCSAGCRGLQTASRQHNERWPTFTVSQVPSSREVGRPWGPRSPGLSLSRVPFGFQLMAWKESELVLPLAQCPSAFLYCLLLLDMAAATSGSAQIPRGPGGAKRPRGLLNLDPYFLEDYGSPGCLES